MAHAIGHRYVPRNRIKVLVEDGRITLSGEVARDFQRRAATDSVRTLMGVKGVANQMTLASGRSPPGSGIRHTCPRSMLPNSHSIRWRASAPV
jgi:osmotically-inducible protein OsmY